MSLAAPILHPPRPTPIPSPSPPRTPARLRVVPAPDCEPAPLRVPPAPDPPAGPHRQLRLLVRPDPAPEPTDDSGRPDPDVFTRAVCQGIVDVLAGRRAPQQMMRWLRPDLFDTLRRRASASTGRPGALAGRRAVVRSVRTCRVTPDVVEAAAVVVDGRSARAMAIRLEAVGRRWRVTAMVIG